MAHTGRPWTAAEDHLLTQAVALHGETDQWKAIALCVPGRTNKACRKRWLHSLSPTVKKSSWTAAEDRTLLSLYALHGTKWSLIARHIPGRTDDACSKRYREALDPSLRKDEWTETEDARLLDAYTRIGGKWGIIGNELQRSGLGCRNRWRMIERKKASALRKVTHVGESFVGSSSVDGEGHLPQHWNQITEYDDTQYWDVPPTYHPPPVDITSTGPNELNIPYHSHTHTQTFNNTAAVGPSFPYASSSLGQAAYLPQNPLHGVTTIGIPRSDPVVEYSEPTVNTTSHVTSMQTGSFARGLVNRPQSQVHSPPHIGYGDRTPFSHPSPQARSTFNVSSDRYGTDRYGTVPGSSRDERTFTTTFKSGVQERHDIREPYKDTIHADVTRAEEVFSDIETPDLGPNESVAGCSTPTSPTFPVEALPTSATVASQHQTPSHIRPKTNYQKKRTEKDGPPPRLSSTLALSNDPSVAPYACGNKQCWPAGTPKSVSCFSTSGELSNHYKAEHGGDMITDEVKPFRCALEGCGKGWKSVNGLQYHLQISKAHFREALSTQYDNRDRRVGASNRAAQLPRDTSKRSLAANDEEKKTKKTFPCPHEGCTNSYKQLSGLRYHLAHGHSQSLPEQVDMIPPTLARRVSERTSATGRDE